MHLQNAAGETGVTLDSSALSSRHLFNISMLEAASDLDNKPGPPTWA